jgi:hypothetical protein
VRIWGTGPVDWILPGVLIVLWLTLRRTRRGTPTWWYAVGFALVLLCVPAGAVAAAREFEGEDCTPDDLCFSIDQVHWWLNGILGLFTLGALILVTLIIGHARRPLP